MTDTSHKLGPWLCAPLVILAYHFSLAAAQALFEAVLLIGPGERKKTTRRTITPHVIASFAVFQAAMLEAVPWTLAKLEHANSSSRSSWQAAFVIGQAFLLVVSILLPVISLLANEEQHEKEQHEFGGLFEWGRDRTRAAGWSWAVIGVSSLLLQVHSIWRCFEDARPTPLWRWSHLASVLQPWHHATSKQWKNTAYQVVGLLGDHPWINALAWDVIFSAIVVGVVATVSSLEVKEMLQCSLAPWIDDAVVAAEQVSEIVQDAAGTSIAKGQEVFDQARTATRSGLLSVASAGLEKGQQLAASSSYDLAETVEGKLGHFKDLVDAQANSAGENVESSSRITRSHGRRRASRSRNSQAQGDESADVLPRRSNRSRDSRSTKARSTPEETTAGSSIHQALHSLHLADDALGIAEQGGLAYALIISGGLGLASAAVFGSAVMYRERL